MPSYLSLPSILFISATDSKAHSRSKICRDWLDRLWASRVAKREPNFLVLIPGNCNTDIVSSSTAHSNKQSSDNSGRAGYPTQIYQDCFKDSRQEKALAGLELRLQLARSRDLTSS